jgi:hypothetical protein
MMTLDEFTELFEILLAAYPNHKFRSDDDMGRTLLIWYSLLNDLKYEILEAAIRKHILQSGNTFFPSIYEIRTKALEVVLPDGSTAADAWGEVTKAIRQFGYMRKDEALQSMTPLTRKVVEAIGWREICTSEEPDIIRAQFRMAYEQMAGREKQEALLPEGMKQKIRELAGGMKMIGGRADGL